MEYDGNSSVTNNCKPWNNPEKSDKKTRRSEDLWIDWDPRDHSNFEIGVEKRKISYFGLALNLFQHLISPNQDGLSYSARTFISGLQNG